MHDKLEWSDYEIVLHIADAGSLSKAAQRAGTSHPTLFRRVNAVETKLGVRLFERFRSGYQLTPAGEQVAEAAREISRLTNETERRIAGRDLRPSGVVRLATTDSLLAGLLMPMIVGFRRTEPAIHLDVILSNDITDLSFREADIAIRPSSSPDPQLVGRRLGVIRQGVYAAKSLGADNLQNEHLARYPWIGPSHSMPYSQLHIWMRQTQYDLACVCRMDSVLAMRDAVRSAIGIALLPCYLADVEADLIKIGGDVEELSIDLWILTHPDLRKTARIRAALDYFSRVDAFLHAVSP